MVSKKFFPRFSICGFWQELMGGDFRIRRLDYSQKKWRHRKIQRWMENKENTQTGGCRSWAQIGRTVRTPLPEHSDILRDITFRRGMVSAQLLKFVSVACSLMKQFRVLFIGDDVARGLQLV
ncbi:hypothetical protein HPP92_017829 [Vanilla planifolia]|uniref:Uncharacterized protein n=1 Tax=Vanilla planifolia TaxID=51239 RepID=A0A835Q5Y3_VANPL|nr:hypothetical protein HPP92_017829 [Vanilla planifolia]